MGRNDVGVSNFPVCFHSFNHILWSGTKETFLSHCLLDQGETSLKVTHWNCYVQLHPIFSVQDWRNSSRFWSGGGRGHNLEGLAAERQKGQPAAKLDKRRGGGYHRPDGHQCCQESHGWDNAAGETSQWGERRSSVGWVREEDIADLMDTSAAKKVMGEIRLQVKCLSEGTDVVQLVWLGRRTSQTWRTPVLPRKSWVRWCCRWNVSVRGET